MDRILDLATGSFPAWLIVLAVVGWLVVGKELVARALNRDERRIARKKANLELSRVELEQEKLRKEAVQAGIILKTPIQEVTSYRWITPAHKILTCAVIALGCLAVFIILPLFAMNMSNPYFKKHAGLLAVLLLVDGVVSMFCPLLLRTVVSDGLLIAYETIAAFIGLALIVGCGFSIAEAYGFSVGLL